MNSTFYEFINVNYRTNLFKDFYSQIYKTLSIEQNIKCLTMIAA